MKLTKETKAEFVGQIVDLFEDYSDRNHIAISNRERDEAQKDNKDLAIIYGKDYDAIAGPAEILADRIIEANMQSSTIGIEEVVDLAMNSISSFESLFGGNIPAKDVEVLSNQIAKTCQEWKIVDGRNTPIFQCTTPQQKAQIQKVL